MADVGIFIIRILLNFDTSQTQGITKGNKERGMGGGG